MDNNLETILKYVDIIDDVDFLESLCDKIHRCKDPSKDSLAECVLDRIKQLAPQWFLNAKVVQSSGETVNGYALRDSHPQAALMSHRTYLQLKALWNDDYYLTHEEFVDRFELECPECVIFDEEGRYTHHRRRYIHI